MSKQMHDSKCRG